LGTKSFIPAEINPDVRLSRAATTDLNPEASGLNILNIKFQSQDWIKNSNTIILNG